MIPIQSAASYRMIPIQSAASYRMIPIQSAAFIPSSHKSKNSVAVETGLLHSQKFTNSHYYFLVNVE
jgi:hypothetical protein